MVTPNTLAAGGAERKLIWCSEICRKATSSNSRDQLANIAADVGAEFKWFKKAATFSRWFTEENPRTLYLLTDWREAKPCAEEIDKASKELPDLGSIIMMVLCTENKTATRAHSWASLWASLSTVRPRIVRNFSDVKWALRVISSKQAGDASDPLCRGSYKVPRAPVPPLLEPLSWVKLKLAPPLLLPRDSNQEPAPNRSVSLPTEPWRVPRWVEAANPGGPKEVLPQPVRILGGSQPPSVQPPSSPPWPVLLISHKGKLAEATLGAMAEVDTEAETEPEVEDPPPSVETLISKLLEVDAPAPGVAAAAEAAAEAEAEAEACAATVGANSANMVGAAETPVQDWTQKALAWMLREDDAVPLCF